MGLLAKTLNNGQLKKKSKNEEAVSEIKHQTGIDKIYNLVEKMGSVLLNDIPGILGISKEDVEKYARILSKDDLIILYYPTIGSAELKSKNHIKKKKNVKLRDVYHNKKILAFIIGIIIIMLSTAAYISITKDKKIKSLESITEAAKAEKTKVPKKEVTIGTAFSGEGTYNCNLKKNEITSTYYIKDKKSRIETIVNGGNTIVIIKEGFTYTYLEQDNKWTKLVTSEGSIIPGSGKIPTGEGIGIECFESSVEDSQFYVNEEDII